jgi:hypothetical protein
MPIPVGEGIVTPAGHARVMAEVDRRRAIVRRGKNASRISGVTGSGRPPKYLLTGLVRCGECGGAMVVRVGKRTRYVRGEFPEPEDVAQYDQLRKRLLERRNAAREALDRLGPGPTVDVGALLETELSREAWERTTLHQKRALLSLALTKVFVRGSEGGRIPMRDRVHVVWIGDDPPLPLRKVQGKAAWSARRAGGGCPTDA